MKRKNRNHGYSTELAKDYLDDRIPIISLSTQTSKQYVWKDGHKTDTVSGYHAWFVQQEVGPFKVKFEREPKLPQFLSQVELVSLQACEVGNNVYFKAKDIKG